jgi:hypothetical protein
MRIFRQSDIGSKLLVVYKACGSDALRDNKPQLLRLVHSLLSTSFFRYILSLLLVRSLSRSLSVVLYYAFRRWLLGRLSGFGPPARRFG